MLCIFHIGQEMSNVCISRTINHNLSDGGGRSKMKVNFSGSAQSIFKLFAQKFATFRI